MTRDVESISGSRASQSAEERRVAKEKRDLDHMVHAMLLVGLVISTALMLFGLGLAVFQGQAVPTNAPDLAEALEQVMAFSPAGFLTLGLLVLIATPILRVVGSIAAFAYERDWRYAFITLIVFMVVMLSLLTGHG